MNRDFIEYVCDKFEAVMAARRTPGRIERGVVDEPPEGPRRWWLMFRPMIPSMEDMRDALPDLATAFGCEVACQRGEGNRVLFQLTETGGQRMGPPPCPELLQNPHKTARLAY